ncbi:sodium/hydrogen exchanger 9B1-like [Anthonomus grandis grandis]|uniref:sodium/hydrogen exchanger 9B1-like n=1 Tax=Anthonomus grandis grandis TaxID=2921223 RepID=UPI0021668996|nr:sodium/hydrogen exchanger 9B1-like [Anthonomus grandis grandis]
MADPLTNVTNLNKVTSYDLNGYKPKQESLIHCLNGIDNMGLEPEIDSKSKANVNRLTRSLSQISNTSRKSKTRFSDNGDDNPRSWWYAFCLKCRSKESTPASWEPQYWSYLCPHPFCPDYRSMARLFALIIIGVVSWCIFYTIVGEIAAPPSGILFQLLILILISKFGGWLVSLTSLPGLIGMLFTGLILQNLNVVDIDETFSPITKHLRRMALVLILIRAGLDLDPVAFKRVKWSVIKLGLGPWFIEAAIVCVMGYYLLNLPWLYSFALGSVIAAVSPAVTVVCILRLRTKGYGIGKGIPTLIIAIAGIDDAVSVAIFGIIESTMNSQASLTSIIIQAPVSIIGGIAFGIFWGMICHYAPERKDPYVSILRVSLLLVGCTVAVFGSEYIGYGGAGPLACVAGAFTALVVWTKQGWDVEENPASESFEILWMFFEPILFSITGAQIRLNELDGNVVLLGLGILVASSVIRIVGTVVLGIGCSLNLKEKVFCAVSLMAKATVQAALGPVLLGLVSDNSSDDKIYSEKVLMVCVLSIMLTAPTAAAFMTIAGPRLLTRTTEPFSSEKLRKSLRLSVRSLRNLTVDIDRELADDEEKKCLELPKDLIQGDHNKM